jgi:hypothetical protein
VVAELGAEALSVENLLAAASANIGHSIAEPALHAPEQDVHAIH